MLTSLEIKNFRAFSHLAVERLSRVNLIVGKNNVGKTTLLEALRICGSTQLPMTVHSILDARNEVRASSDLTASGEHKRHFEVTALWHGRKARADNDPRLWVRADDGAVREFCFDVLSEGISGEWSLAIDLPNSLRCFFNRDGSTRFVGSLSEEWLDLPVDAPYLVGSVTDENTENLAASWWDATWMSGGREQVLKLIQSLVSIEDVIFVRDPRHPKRRMARARVAGNGEPVPLASMGDGVARLFYIALAMEYARYRADRVRRMPEEPGMSFSSESGCLYSYLLIDEIDTGVHHSLHHDLWKFIFRAASSLDVQVFATTHSLDCLRGFAEAAAEDEEADAQVIRLEEVEGEDQTGAVVIDREGLPIVIRDSIEVR